MLLQEGAKVYDKHGRHIGYIKSIGELITIETLLTKPRPCNHYTPKQFQQRGFTTNNPHMPDSIR